MSPATLSFEQRHTQAMVEAQPGGGAWMGEIDLHVICILAH